MGQAVSNEWRTINLNCTQCCGVVEDEENSSIIIDQNSAHQRALSVRSGRSSIRRGRQSQDGFDASPRLFMQGRMRGAAASQCEGDLSNISVIMSQQASDSYVTREFNQAFQFLQAKAEV